MSYAAQRDIPIGRITGIQFSMINDKEYKGFTEVNPSIPIENIDPLESNELGIAHREEGTCAICHASSGDGINEQPCPGHFGRISLRNIAIYHPMLIEKLAQVMSCFCSTCNKLKIRNKIGKYEANIDKENEIIQEMKSNTPQFLFIPSFFNQSRDIECCDHKEFFKADRAMNKITLMKKGKEISTETEKMTEDEYTCEHAELFLEELSNKDLELLGFKNNPPENMIMHNLPVLPKICRPTILNNGRMSHDQLSDAYQTLIDTVKVEEAKLETTKSKEEREASQEHIATKFANLLRTPKLDNAGEKATKGITDRLRGKYGIFRNNCMGKRVNYCSRSVISGDPTIQIDELGVPRTVASRLSFPEIVNTRNKDFLQKMVNNGTRYPGANFVEKGGATIRCDENARVIKLDLGDVVHRHLLDGDYIMFNRQPSLHKMSFMSHRVKVMPYSTFRLNLCAAKPYNADFDGDEMNFHEPESLEAISELSEIMLVSKQIVSCKNNGPLISIVQDSLVGCYIMSEKDKFIDKTDFQKFMMFLSYPDELYKEGYSELVNRNIEDRESGEVAAGEQSSSVTTSTTGDNSAESIKNKFYAGSKNVDNPYIAVSTPQPAILYPEALWTGKQLFSMSLPTSLSLDIGKRDEDSIMEDASQIILQGEFLTGIVSNKVVGQAEGGLIHVLFKDYGYEYCKSFLDNCERTVTNYMIEHSFSVGFGDMIISPNARKEADDKFVELSKAFEVCLKDSVNGNIKLAPGQTEEEGFEGKFNTILEQNEEQLEQIVKKDLPKRNALINMVVSGSKGKVFNIMEISTCLGQQYLHGSRMNYKFTSFRTIPHFTMYNYDMLSRGYVNHSFMQGLSPTEFHFHMCGGREGVSDTAIKTSDSGYVERKMMKNMESLFLDYDNSVRNDINSIVEFRYGDDSLDPHQCETHRYNTVEMTDEKFVKLFYVDYDEIAKQGEILFAQESQNDVFEFEDLINKLSVVKDGLSDFSLTDPLFEPFNIVVDNDLIDFNKLKQYLKVHISNFLNTQQEDIVYTLPLNNSQIEELKIEYLALLIEKYWIEEIEVEKLELSNAKSKDDIGVLTSICDIERVINRQIVNNKVNIGLTEKLKSDMEPEYVVEKVNELIHKMKNSRANESKEFRVLLRELLSSKNVVFNLCLKKSQFDEILFDIEKRFRKSGIQPGEPCGPIASHSISEPATQLTLNTFHTAGTSALGSLGLPRLKELLDFRNTPIPIMSIFLKNTVGNIKAENTDEDRVREEAEGKELMKLAAQLENTYFKDLVENWTIIFDPEDKNSLIESDKDWLSIKEQLDIEEVKHFSGEDNITNAKSKTSSPFVIRYEMSLQKLIEKEDANITLNVIANKIGRVLDEDDDNTGAEVNYYNGIGPAIIRIRPKSSSDVVSISKIEQLNNRLLDVHISGLPLIKKVFENEYDNIIEYGCDIAMPAASELYGEVERLNPVDKKRFGGIFYKNLKFKENEVENDIFKEMFIRTEGSDLLSVLNMDAVDSTRTFCNDLPEVYTVLGIEACRNLLFKEMRSTLPSDNLNNRHFLMLSDVMMVHPYNGKMSSINRHGMHITNTGTLTQASFEEPGDVLLDAGAFGLLDNCQAISSTVLVGKEMRLGTGAFDLLLDLSMLPPPPEIPHPRSAISDEQTRRNFTEEDISVEESSVNNEISSAEISENSKFSVNNQGSAGAFASGFSHLNESQAASAMLESVSGLSNRSSQSEVSKIFSAASQRSEMSYEQDEYNNAGRKSMDHSESAKMSASSRGGSSSRSMSAVSNSHDIVNNSAVDQGNAAPQDTDNIF